ncbi:MAG: thiamine pyrophosphate-dependent enzyme [Candidatus Helarchaeales archaeon]
MKDLIAKYLRNLPTKFCPGCGNGIVLNAFIRALDELQLDLSSILSVSGIGCSAWIPSPYLKLDSFHTLHGRAIAYATGAKVANPSLNVIVFTGDGDGAGIGGNHLIHAARRNIDLTVLLINNQIYGMTGGQMAPTTPHRAITSTSQAGNPERAFDLCRLLEGAGATYIARWTVFQTRELIKSIKEGITHEGFSFIEILSPCPTQFGRRNNMTIRDYYREFKKLEKEDEQETKMPLGLLVKKDEPEFCKQLEAISMRMKRDGGSST